MSICKENTMIFGVSKSKCDLPPWGKGRKAMSFIKTVLTVGNNSMPPLASTPFGTSECDYPSRIYFGKKQRLEIFKRVLAFRLIF